MLAAVAGVQPSSAAGPNEAAARNTIALNSSLEVMKDPLVAQCARQFGKGYGFGQASPILEASYKYEFELLFQDVVDCRMALQRYPTEPTVIIYNTLASTFLAIAILGFDAPDDEAERIALVKSERSKEGPITGVLANASAFYVGQAYAYGAGVEQDLKQALIWYGQASDKVSAREREAILSAHPELKQ